MSTRSAEVANHHKPPPTCTGHSIRQPNPSPALSPGKVGPQHRRPVTGHRRLCRRQPGCRHRTRRSEKPTSAFSITRLTARRRRPPHPTVRRRPQRRRRSRVVGRRHNEQRRQGPPLQCAAHRPPSSPHGKPPPANEVPADRRPEGTRAGCATASPPRARRCRRRTGTHPTSKRRRSSVEPQIRPWQRRIRPAHHLAVRTADPAGEPLQWPEAATPARSTGARRKGPAAAFLAGARRPGDLLG
jgi:hypothetical protein